MLQSQNKTSDISLCSFNFGPAVKEAARTVSLNFGENTNIREVEFVLAADNFVIGINYRILSEDPKEQDEWKQAMQIEGLKKVYQKKIMIPLGFKIVGVLLRDGVHVQDLLIARVFATKQYRALCEREVKRLK